MEKMLKRVGLCSGRRTIDSTDSNTKQQHGGEVVDSKALTKADTVADKESEVKGDPVRDLPLCDVVNSNEWALRQRLAGGVDGAEGVVASGELFVTEDETDGGERVTCGQVDRRCWRRSRVLFHFQLDSHIMEFKPRALTRRLCGGKKHDNELYRSNSFKFERFERKDVGPLQKQISLCDDYSIPVDFVNKRPRSIGGGLANWTTPSPSGDTVEVIETYSDPRDSKAYLRPGDEPSGAKLYTSPDRDYSQPYPVAPPPPPSPPPLPSAEPRAEEEEAAVEEAVCLQGEPIAVSIIDEGVSFDEGVYEAVGDDQKQNQLGVCFKDDDSISGEVGEDILEAETHFLQVNPPQRRHPSPYYYADLFREEEEEGEKREEEDEDKEGVGEEEAPIQDTQLPQREHHHHKHHHQHRHHHLHHHQHKHHHRHHHHHRHKHRIKEHRHSCEAEEGGEEGEEEPLDEVLPSHLLSDSPAAVGTSTVEVEGSASGGVVVAQGSGGSGGPEAGYGGGGPAPAFLAACLLRDWDLIFTTPASITGTAARSSTPSGTKGVARGLRACSCRGGRCVRGEEDEDGEVECCEVPLEEGEEEDMSGRQRHLYETAFDCKVRRSQDDLDEVDRVSNHPVLRMLPAALVRAAAAVSPRTSRSVQTKEVTSTPPKDRRKLTLTRSDPQPPVTREPKRPDERCAEEKAEVERPADLPSFQTPPSLKGPVGSGHAPSPPPLRGYAPSPPSTAPLPTKFHNRGSHMNSLCSAPDLPAGRISSPARTKDSRLPVKSRRGRHGTDGPILEFKDRPAEEEMEEEEDERIEVREAVEGRSVVVVGRPSRAHCRPTLVPPSGGARPKYSSTESMATSSSAMSSLESLRSSTSEGNRSTSSSGSRRSSSLSSHSSDSGSARLLDLHRLHLHHHHHHHHGSSQASQQLGGHQTGHPQLHILSPISDKSQEPASETSDNNRNNNSQGASPEERLSSPAAVDNLPSEPNPVPTLISDHPISPPRPEAPSSPQTLLAPTPWEGAPKLKRRVLVLQNKNLLNRALVQAAAAAAATSSSGEAEVQGSDSGISIESSSQGQCGVQVGSVGSGEGGVTMGHEDLRALPFDMPKLRRRLAADASGSSSTSVASNSRPDDLRALPFDMPKLRRRLRQQQSADGLELDGSSGVSQASSSQSVLELEINSRKNGKPLLLGQLPGATQPQASIVRPNLTLNLCGPTSGPSLPSSHSRKKRPGLSLELGCSALSAAGEPVDVSVPLERQGWYHGAITRVEAESVLRLTKEGSYLVRNSESTRQDYSLSLKSARGFMHMRIQQNKDNGRYILGQFSQPFSSIPEMIHFYTINRLPIKGAEHMCLLHPVIEQLL